MEEFILIALDYNDEGNVISGNYLVKNIPPNMMKLLRKRKQTNDDCYEVYCWLNFEKGGKVLARTNKPFVCLKSFVMSSSN